MEYQRNFLLQALSMLYSLSRSTEMNSQTFNFNNHDYQFHIMKTFEILH